MLTDEIKKYKMTELISFLQGQDLELVPVGRNVELEAELERWRGRVTLYEKETLDLKNENQKLRKELGSRIEELEKSLMPSPKISNCIDFIALAGIRMLKNSKISLIVIGKNDAYVKIMKIMEFLEVWYDEKPEIVIPKRIQKIKEFVCLASKRFDQ